MFSGKEDFKIETLPIVGGYNVQRFTQFSPEDSANWTVYKAKNAKKEYAMYPTLGRAHIKHNGINQFIYGSQPRSAFKSIKFHYAIDGNSIYRVDDQYNKIQISGSQVTTIAGTMYFAYLVVNALVFACFVDGQNIYVYQEDTGVPGNTGAFFTVTDPNAPGIFTVNGMQTKPGYIAAFGNRIVVSVANSSQFVLSVINLLSNGVFNPATCFTGATGQIFAQEDGIIRQMGVLNNTLYIFTDFITGVWSNIAAVFPVTGVSFPWKKNSTYNWNFGIANPKSLDIDFGLMVFLAQNSDGLLQFMKSNGGQPEKISDEAIDVLLQRYVNRLGNDNPFLVENSNGFLFQYENKILYRMSGGDYVDYQILDQEQDANSIEFDFDTETWHRVIELNGNRNRVQLHVYFNNMHLVTVTGDNTIYNMSGDYYYNEIRNPNQPDGQAADAYLAYPFRYERNTPIIYEKDYSEFETEYAQIDFVFGQSILNYSVSPFLNAVFIVSEQSTPSAPIYIIDEQLDASGQPVFMLTENSNTPMITDLIYNYLLNPSIMLYWSDDGGVSFNSADNLQFSQMGVYQWRMRWYQLGCSRNRVYRLVCVSFVPVVILGAVMNVRRVSGGAN